MTARNPITAHTAPGWVVLVVDVDTAVAIADSVELGVTSGGVSTVGRPLGLDDVEHLRTAAAQAAADADPDTPVLLGGVSATRALRMVPPIPVSTPGGEAGVGTGHTSVPPFQVHGTDTPESVGAGGTPSALSGTPDTGNGATA